MSKYLFIHSTLSDHVVGLLQGEVERINRYLDKYYCKRLILSHHKNLLRGDYIIDDRGKHGTSGFKGEWLRFGSQEFPNWESVLEYLQA